MPIIQVVHNSAILIQSVLSWSLFVFRTMLCIYMYIFCCVLSLHVMYLKVQKFCRHCAYDCDNYHILLFLCFTGWRLPFVFTFHIQGCHVLHNFSILIGKLHTQDDFAVYFGQQFCMVFIPRYWNLCLNMPSKCGNLLLISVSVGWHRYVLSSL